MGCPGLEVVTHIVDGPMFVRRACAVQIDGREPASRSATIASAKQRRAIVWIAVALNPIHLSAE